MTEESRSKTIERLKTAAEKVFAGTSVLFAYFYGSRAKNKAHLFSDFDIAIYVKSAIPLNQELSLSIKLEEVSGLKEIDLRTLNKSPLIFQGKVVQEGVLIYSQDEKTRINFERVILHKYLDYLPHLKAFERKFLKKVATEGLL